MIDDTKPRDGLFNGAASRHEMDASRLRTLIAGNQDDHIRHLRYALANEGGGLGVSRMNDHRLVEQVARMVQQGRLHVEVEPFRNEIRFSSLSGVLALKPIFKPTGLSGGSSSMSKKVEEAFSEPKKKPQPEPEKHWAEFQLTDETTGKPISDVALRLKLPDGKIKTVRSDSRGLVRIDDVENGAVEILDMDDDKAWQVANIS